MPQNATLPTSTLPPVSAAKSGLKCALRPLLLAQRHTFGANRNPHSLHRWLEQAAHHLNTHHAGQTVALYAPHKGEVNVLGLATLISHPLCLPVVLGAPNAPRQALQFARWQPSDTLTTDRYGIATPAQHDWLVPSVLLVPCVAYTAGGWRLGYGGGYYDRTLAALRAHNPDTFAIGVAWQSARCEFEPDAHDQPMDAVWAV